jgi:hypothetical protein
MDTVKSKLIDALENTSAALENVLLHAAMSEDDKAGRSKTVTEAKELLATARANRSGREAYYFTLARDQWQEEGEVEIDDDAVVSMSEEGEEVTGAYVQAWVWVENPKQG